ncbi:MAG: hypothetical protein V3W41_14655 [Planctomycetota bacterium]
MVVTFPRAEIERLQTGRAADRQAIERLQRELATALRATGTPGLSTAQHLLNWIGQNLEVVRCLRISYSRLQEDFEHLKGSAEDYRSQATSLQAQLTAALAVDETWTGCGTGDCPHPSAQECVAALVAANVALIRENERHTAMTSKRTLLDELEPLIEQLPASVFENESFAALADQFEADLPTRSERTRFRRQFERVRTRRLAEATTDTEITR